MTFNSCVGMYGIPKDGPAFVVIAKQVESSSYVVQRLLPDMKLAKPEIFDRQRIERSRFYVSRESWESALGLGGE